MLLEQWALDIHKALTAIGEPLSEQVTLSLNNALFTLIKSPLWRSEFDGFTLQRSAVNPALGWVVYDTAMDPLSNGDLELHHDGRLNLVHNFYQLDRNWDDESGMHTPWPSPYAHETQMLETPLADPLTERILSQLRSTSSYYAMLLEEDPAAIRSHQTRLNQIQFSFLEADDDPVEAIIGMARMNPYNWPEIKEIFGHRYFSGSNVGRSYIVAHNDLGPVGLLCLFNPPADAAGHAFYWSVSYVSVTPAYRGQGIATNMLLEAFRLAHDQGRFITRTRPTDIGKAVLYDAYTCLGQNNIYQIPFVEPALSDIAIRLSHDSRWRALEAGTRHEIINLLLAFCRERCAAQNDLSDLYDLRHEDGQRALQFVEPLLEQLPRPVKTTSEVLTL